LFPYIHDGGRLAGLYGAYQFRAFADNLSSSFVAAWVVTHFHNSHFEKKSLKTMPNRTTAQNLGKPVDGRWGSLLLG
jgi:hypothetical protein